MLQKVKHLAKTDNTTQKKSHFASISFSQNSSVAYNEWANLLKWPSYTGYSSADNDKSFIALTSAQLRLDDKLRLFYLTPAHLISQRYLAGDAGPTDPQNQTWDQWLLLNPRLPAREILKENQSKPLKVAGVIYRITDGSRLISM